MRGCGGGPGRRRGKLWETRGTEYKEKTLGTDTNYKPGIGADVGEIRSTTTGTFSRQVKHVWLAGAQSGQNPQETDIVAQAVHPGPSRTRAPGGMQRPEPSRVP